jgi:hypothetical protein
VEGNYICKAFSCIVEPNCKVTWKLGVDSHEELIKMAGVKDDTTDPSKMAFARVEITPVNGNYLFPDEWTLKIDEQIKPVWWTGKHEGAAYSAHRKWITKLNKIVVKKKIVNPFKLIPPTSITTRHIGILREWDSIRDSVRDSVRDSIGESVWGSVWDSIWDSVRDSVGDSIRDSIEDSVWDSVKDSVWDSVGAYIGSFFRPSKWKYVKHLKGKYPFRSAALLWNMGLVPSFDGKVWRLHGHEDTRVVFEIKAKDLRK